MPARGSQDLRYVPTPSETVDHNAELNAVKLLLVLLSKFIESAGETCPRGRTKPGHWPWLLLVPPGFPKLLENTGSFLPGWTDIAQPLADADMVKIDGTAQVKGFLS